MVRPRTGTSELLLPPPLRPLDEDESDESLPSAASAAAFNCAILSASNAASSASGESGMVSRLDILGLLDRADVGVEGTDENPPPYGANASYARNDEAEELDEGVEGKTERELVLGGAKLRSGDAGRRRFMVLKEVPRIGEVLLSPGVDRRSGSRTEVRTGDVGGNASSTGFRGVRTRLGDPDGLAGRSCGE